MLTGTDWEADETAEQLPGGASRQLRRRGQHFPLKLGTEAGSPGLPVQQRETARARRARHRWQADVVNAQLRQHRPRRW